MYRAEITVTLRPAILDVQGKTVENALHALGHDDVAHVRIGKHITLDVDAPDATAAEETARRVSEQLLSNPVIEDFAVRVIELSKGEE